MTVVKLTVFRYYSYFKFDFIINCSLSFAVYTTNSMYHLHQAIDWPLKLFLRPQVQNTMKYRHLFNNNDLRDYLSKSK